MLGRCGVRNCTCGTKTNRRKIARRNLTECPFSEGLKREDFGTNNSAIQMTSEVEFHQALRITSSRL